MIDTFKQQTRNIIDIFKLPKNLFLYPTVLLTILLFVFAFVNEFQSTKQRDSEREFNNNQNIIKLSIDSIIRSEKIKQVDKLVLHEQEITAIASKNEKDKLLLMIITDLNHRPIFTNFRDDRDSQAQKLILHSYDRDSPYIISKFNLKGARNKLGNVNTIGYVYFARNPERVKTINRDLRNIWLAAIVTKILIILVYCTLVYMIIQRNNLVAILKNKESATIEFKAHFYPDSNSISANTKSNSKNLCLEYECAKVIASFMNTNGGYLLIGISDDGKVIGIDRDLQYVARKSTQKTYQKDSEDEYKRKLKGKLEHQLNKKAVSKLVISIFEISSRQISNSAAKKILIIRCSPLPRLTLNKKRKGGEYEACFRSDSETIVYQKFNSKLVDNQILPFDLRIVNNFSGSSYLLKQIVWSIKKLLIQL